MHRRPLSWKESVWLWAPGMALLCAACTQDPTIAIGPGTSVSDARRVLLLSAADGPVPLVIDQPPAVLGSPGDVANLAEKGAAPYAHVTFVPQVGSDAPADRVRLIYRFVDLAPGDPAIVCKGQAQAQPSAAPSGPPRLQAVFCDQDKPVANAVGIAAGPDRPEVARLVTQTTSALFPPNDSSYGSNYGGFPGVSIFGGVGVGSGGHSGGGVGVGLGF